MNIAAWNIGVGTYNIELASMYKQPEMRSPYAPKYYQASTRVKTVLQCQYSIVQKTSDVPPLAATENQFHNLLICSMTGELFSWICQRQESHRGIPHVRIHIHVIHFFSTHHYCNASTSQGQRTYSRKMNMIFVFLFSENTASVIRLTSGMIFVLGGHPRSIFTFNLSCQMKNMTSNICNKFLITGGGLVNHMHLPANEYQGRDGDQGRECDQGREGDKCRESIVKMPIHPK